MKYRIDWKSTSAWAGTERTEEEGDELYDTKEDAEAALVAFEQDGNYMNEVQNAAVEGQGVEGFLSIEEVR
jgi:hypothetical protein